MVNSRYNRIILFNRCVMKDHKDKNKKEAQRQPTDWKQIVIVFVSIFIILSWILSLLSH